jgi:hypothetical protein
MIQFTKDKEIIFESKVSDVLKDLGYIGSDRIVHIIIGASERFCMDIEPLSWAGVVGQLYKTIYKETATPNEYAGNAAILLQVVFAIMDLERLGFKLEEEP